MERVPILVIEADPEAALDAQEALGRAGYAPFVTTSAHSALALFNRVRPALVFAGCGRGMAAITGDFLSCLRRLPGGAETPVAVVAADDRYDECLPFLRQGLADDVLRRPAGGREYADRAAVLLVRRGQQRTRRESLRDTLSVIGDLSFELRERNAELTRQLRLQHQSSVRFVHSLVRALESKDRYTAHHSARVTKYALAAARRAGVAKRELGVLKRAAMLHDIGKIGIDLSYINKQGPLTDAEHGAMSLHPLLGEKILRPVATLSEEIVLIRHHHERWDGSGYPYSLRREEIGILTGILSVCDSFDAMTSDRSYRSHLPVGRALDEIRANRERQFHPEAVDAFLPAWEQAEREMAAAG